jgi:hypothetical protein
VDEKIEQGSRERMKRKGILRPLAVTLVLITVAAGTGLFLHGSNGTTNIATQQIEPPTSAPAMTTRHPTESSRHPRPHDHRIELSGTRAFRVASHLPRHNVSALTYVQQRESASKLGDSSATYEIYMQVSACRRAISPNDPEVFQAYGRTGMEAQYASSIERTLEQCRELASHTEWMGRNWLAVAAEQGSTEARLIYAMAPEEFMGMDAFSKATPQQIEFHRGEATRHLRESASEGSLDALAALGHIHGTGVRATEDVVQSYAYKRTVQRADPTQLASEELHNLRVQMSPQEVREAETRSDQIYSECCAL